MAGIIFSSGPNETHFYGRILTVRGQRVVLDSDLAEFYGVETRALNRQVSIGAEYRHADYGHTTYDFGSGGAPDSTSEAARIDLNKAPKELLANLFEVLGAEQKAAEQVAVRIDGWRTKPKTGATNDEEALYLASGLTY